MLSNSQLNKLDGITRLYVDEVVSGLTMSGGSVFSTANGVTIGVGIAENGSIQNESAVSVRTTTLNVPFSFALQDIIQVENGDYFEVWVRNESGTQNVTLSDVNVIIQKITG
jgi:hypothetical protein